MPAAEPTHQEQPERPGPDEPDSSGAPGKGVPPAHAEIAIALALHVNEPDPPLTGWLDAQLKQAAILAGVSHATLSLAVVGDDDMARLHEQYTGVAGTTDVLTFDLSGTPGSDRSTPGSPQRPLDGDIVTCLDQAQRQAAERKHPARHELLLYAVHGLLHLLGEDDHDDADYQRMHAREDALLEQLGIGRLFAPNPQPPGANP